MIQSRMHKKKEQALVTKQKILEAAEWFFFEKGATTTTLEQIAERAAVTRGAVYGHFKNKSALLEHVVDSATLPILDLFKEKILACDQPSFSHLRQAIYDLVSEISKQPSLARRLTILLHKCELVSQFEFLLNKRKMYRDEVLAVFTNYYEEMLAHGISLSQPPRVLGMATMFYISGLVEDFLLFTSEYDLNRNLDDYLSLLEINSPGSSAK